MPKANKATSSWRPWCMTDRASHAGSAAPPSARSARGSDRRISAPTARRAEVGLGCDAILARFLTRPESVHGGYILQRALRSAWRMATRVRHAPAFTEHLDEGA